MEPARALVHHEHGGMAASQLMLDVAAAHPRTGSDSYRWDGEAWLGNDLNRFTLRTEGEGAFGDETKRAEVQALYSRPIGPYFSLQAGVRHDFRPVPVKTYAALGFEGLAPYWFEVEGGIFLSRDGNLLGRIKGYYEQLVTERLVLQPRTELNFSAKDMREERVGSGFVDGNLELRLRYEIERELAPFLGVLWEYKFGDTARYARADKETASSMSLELGLHVWI